MRKWHLELNPENLELMAYALLKYAPGDFNEEEWRRIDAEVSDLIDEDAAKARRMLEAQAAHVRGLTTD